MSNDDDPLRKVLEGAADLEVPLDALLLAALMKIGEHLHGIETQVREIKERL